MQHRKAIAWGAGILGVAGLLATVLGPSPLFLPLAPLISVVYVPFAAVADVFGTRSGLAELGFAGKGAFVAWSAVLGAVAGKAFGAWRTRRRTRTPRRPE